jgi:hypothetical protein
MRDICLIGDTNVINGHRFDTCYYGTVSKCLGRNYHEKTDRQVIDEVIRFARKYGIELHEHKANEIEKFCMKLNRRRLDLLVLWCDEVLRAREDEVDTPPTKLTGEELMVAIGYNAS